MCFIKFKNVQKLILSFLTYKIIKLCITRPKDSHMVDYDGIEWDLQILVASKKFPSVYYLLLYH